MRNLARLNQLLIMFVPFVISLSSFVMGYFIVYFTMLEQYIQDYHQYSDRQLEIYFTLTYALLPVGAFLSAFFYDHILEIYGQNKLLRFLDYLAIVAIVLQLVTIYTPVLCISRLFMGIFCGFTTGIVPSYIVSISPSFASGIIGSYSQMSIVLGMAFAYYMGQFLDNTTFNDQTALRFFIGLPIITLIVHLITLHLFPFDNIERLIFKRDNTSVRRYLKFVYGKNWKTFQAEIREHKILPVEVAEAPKDDQEEEEHMEPRCKKINEVILGIILAVANQATGINAILEYAKQLFMVIENGDENESDISVLMLGLFQVAMTLAGGFLINRYGRRRMMLIGHGIVIVALFCGFFITFFVDEHESITVLVIFLHVLGFSISLGPILMLYSVQALTSIRLVIIVYWALVTVVTLVSDMLIEQMEIEYIFLLFGICSVLCYCLLYIRMIETKDISRKEIRELIEGTKSEWEKSVDVFRKSTAFPQPKSETLQNV